MIIKKPFSELHDYYNAIFIHIPKSAGSSIEMALYNTWGMVTHTKALTYQKADPKKFNQYYTFTFTRNPYDRFVSAYNYLIKGGRNKFDKSWAKQHLQYKTFNDFVLSLTNPDIRKIIFSYIHFIPQYQFISNENNQIIINKIFQFENLNSDFLELCRTLNIQVKLSHENQFIHPHYLSYYNTESKKIIAKLYETDFQLLNYKPLI